jgi:hypothetical protein
LARFDCSFAGYGIKWIGRLGHFAVRIGCAYCLYVMTDSLDRSFGLIIAFLLPGFICVLSIMDLSPSVASWLSSSPGREPTIAGVSYVVLCSLGTGLVASAIRWLFIDSLMHCTGLRRPVLDFSRLQANLDAFDLAVQHNYRHYQFYANSCIGLWALAVCRLQAGEVWPPLVWVGWVTLQAVMLFAGRDCLRRYYERIGQIISAT